MKSARLFICIVSIAASAHAQTGLLKVADFESGDLSQLRTQKAQTDSLTIVTSPVRAGKHAARTLLRASDPEVSGGNARNSRIARRLRRSRWSRSIGMG